MRLLLLILISITGPFSAFSAIVSKTVFINSGQISTFDGKSFPNLAFNATKIHSPQNEVLVVNVGDTLKLKIVNLDTVKHSVGIDYHFSVTDQIAPNDSSVLTQIFTQVGFFRYYDKRNSSAYTYWGLAGAIHVTNANHKSFYWNLHEYQPEIHDELLKGNTPVWTNYAPSYFTVNGYSNPNINNDKTARPTGFVGDTLLICIVNTGQSSHSLHFHGYHTTILFSSKFGAHVGRSKDTHPIYRGETLILQLVPDKPGEFPVHDHNLVAVTGGGLYPNGMFLTMLISP